MRNGHIAILRRLALPSPFPFWWAYLIPLSLSSTIASLFALAFSTIKVETLESLIHAVLLSCGTCELPPQSPVMRMSLVEPGTPDPIEGVQPCNLGEVMIRPVASDDGLFVEVVADPPRRLYH